MKILSIISSYRRNGNTQLAVGCIEEGIRSSAKEQGVSVEFERIFLGHVHIEVCRGCRACFDRGETLCPLKDELLEIKGKLQAADGVIFASPVYVEDVNGIMKNWIDRMAFNNHRPAFAGKPAVIVTTSGIGSTNHAINTMNKAVQAWGFHVVGRAKFRMGASMEIEEFNARYGARMRDIAVGLYGDASDAKPVSPSFYSLLVFRVQQKYWQKATADQDSVDYLYWRNRGWLNGDCPYFVSHSARALKVQFARLCGDVIAKFFV